MAEKEETLPAVTTEALHRAGLPKDMQMAAGLAIFFDDALYARCKAVALRMSEADGIVGAHLIGKPSACLAILSRAITWNLDPFAVAQATYQTPGGRVGYEGKLVQAILENCGAVEGRVNFKHVGNWEKLRGKFKMASGQGGKSYPVQAWEPADEVGLSVVVSAQIKGEAGPREEEFWLAEMFPRNSTLWATRPKQQICYAAVRAFANIAAPGLLMGIPFDVDPTGFYGDTLTDITPTPKPTGTLRDAFTPPQTPDEPARKPRKSRKKATPAGAPVEESETPLARGMRLLPSQTTREAVHDLGESILTELSSEAEIASWREAVAGKAASIAPPATDA